MLKIRHIPTDTIQDVALICFNNRYIDTYGSILTQEPIYGIPFDECEFIDGDCVNLNTLIRSIIKPKKEDNL